MDLSTERQLAIIDRQIAEWREVGYNAELAARIHTRIGTGADQVKVYVERAAQAEKAIDELRKIREELAEQEQ